MKAAQLNSAGDSLKIVDVPMPDCDAGQVRVQVLACGVCRTDLHIVDGDLPFLTPVIPGHQVVGEIVEVGDDVQNHSAGDIVGIPWLGSTCEICRFCSSGRENLCADAKFTGYDLNGGFAEYCVADAQFCFPIPESFKVHTAAPLLCAGFIGHRALAKAGNANVIGLYGFGSSAHLVLQEANFLNLTVFAFTRPGDLDTQQFARRIGADWAGGSDEMPPELMDAAILFAPVGNLVPTALKSLHKGGRVVCAGIHMSDIPSFPYELLWGERVVLSVANLTRQDGLEFLDIAARANIQPTVQTYELPSINRALEDLRQGRINGSAVITMS